MTLTVSTRESLKYVLKKMDEELEKVDRKVEELKRELNDELAKAADIRRRYDEITQDLVASE